jgi:hypothetical protein
MIRKKIPTPIIWRQMLVSCPKGTIMLFSFLWFLSVPFLSEKGVINYAVINYAATVKYSFSINASLLNNIQYCISTLYGCGCFKVIKSLLLTS